LDQGETPNPDVFCNRHIKFNRFQKHVHNLGFDKMATGHYCSLNDEGWLESGVDVVKDQSYFLSMVPSSSLSPNSTIFPLGPWMKKNVKQLGKEVGLPNQTKSESMGGWENHDVYLNLFLIIYIRNLLHWEEKLPLFHLLLPPSHQGCIRLIGEW